MKMTEEPKAESALDERRDQIKRAALKVFAKQGVSGTKMSAIAAEAGISQGLSYRYFASKEEIFTLLVQEAIDEAHYAVRNINQMPGTPKEQLRAFTQRMMDDSHKEYFLLLQHSMKSDDVPPQAKQHLERYSPNETIDQLVPLVQKGQQAGQFCEGDPQRLLFLYLSVVSGLMLQDVPTTPGYWMKEIDSLMRIIVK